MPVGCQRRNATAWRALQIALLNQVGLDHVFNGFALLANAGGDVVQTHRPAVKAVNHCFEQFAVHEVKALRVHIQHLERQVGNVQGNRAHALDVGVIAHPAQQAVGNTRCAA